jgi:drug/metabolite transporter (DMT)-like permease
LGYLLFKKKSGKLFWTGTFIAILGMVILIGYQNILYLHFNIGIPIAILASLLYAIYIMISKSVLQSISTLTFMFYNMLAASVFLLIICGIDQDNLTTFSVATWWVFIGMGVICQVLGWLTINHALRFLESTKVSISLLAQTALACFMATLFLNEKLGAKEFIGSAIVLMGIAVTFLKRDQSNKIVN